MLHSDFHYPLAFLLVGLLLLLFGRRLFWLFLGAAGFVAGVMAAPYILPHESELVRLLIALVLGIGGAMLAIFVQKAAVAIAGFAGGGYLAVLLGAPLLGGTGLAYPGAWICFVAGGILGAILMVVFFDWALIVLSSLHGARMIIQGLPIASGHLPRHHFPVLFIVLAAIGIVIQASTYRRRAVARE